ncbi:MAG TPA: 50S ribosomal protein L5 [Elusimicrobiota bacterium]|nr:50S ribosomal protein L5 [Elusimicrobiota bacterium]
MNKKDGIDPRMLEAYSKVVIPEMMKVHGYKNVMQVPRLKKIVINIGVSEARENIKVIDLASDELGAITGQKPQVRRAKKSISNFKLRQGLPIGLRVTLRGSMMYEFFDRLVNIALPRVRDFKGVDPKAFDGHGNYNMGLTEQYIFTEVNLEKSDKTRGMNITIVTSARTDAEAKSLLEMMGIPFKKTEKKP